MHNRRSMLAELIGNRPNLIDGLEQKFQKNELQSIRDLAKLSIQQWVELAIQSRSVSNQETEKLRSNDEDSLQAEMMQIVERVEKSFPTAVIAQDLQLRKESGVKLNKEQRDLLTFFTEYPEYEFRDQPVHLFLKENPQAFNDVLNPEQLTRDLQALDRLTKITTRHHERSALWETGQHSAHSIVSTQRQTFINQYADVCGGSREAEKLYAKAGQISALTHVLMASHGDAVYGANPRQVATAKEMPSWDDLFGPVTLCDCDECRYVNSPAAYLVDLLSFLKKHNAIEPLFTRRADIGEIKLSCANTNTALPYIDLVNELLENETAPLTKVNHSTTSGTAEDRAIAPEFYNQGAYELLAKQVYPWALPFNLPTETARIFLGHERIQREQMMRSFQYHKDQLDPAVKIAAESLRCTELDLKLIIDHESGISLHQIWGVSEDVQLIEEMAQVTSFLKHADLSYGELLELLAAKWINPEQKLKLSSYTETDLSKITITHLNEEALDNVHRFLRLRNLLGWTTPELDLTMTTLGVAQFSSPLVQQLALLQKWKKQYAMSLPDLLSWWGTVDTMSTLCDGRSLYDYVFLNETVRNPVDPLFHLNDERTELADPTLTISNNISKVAAPLGLPAADLEYLLENGTDDQLNLATLSQLYRTITMAQSLQLSVREFISLRALAQMDPFNRERFSDTQKLIDTLTEIRRSAFTLDELNYLLAHETEPQSSIMPSDVEVTNVLRNVRDRLSSQTGSAATSHQQEGEQQEQQELVVTLLSDALHLDRGLTHSLLQAMESPDVPGKLAADLFCDPDFLHKTAEEALHPLTPKQFIERHLLQYHAYIRLYKASVLLQKWLVTEEELEFMFSDGVELGWIQLNALPVKKPTESTPLFIQWVLTNDLFSDRLQDGTAALFPTIKQSRDIIAGRSEESLEVVLTDLSTRMEWNLKDLQFSIGPAGYQFQFPDDYSDIRKLVQLTNDFVLLQQLGTSAPTVQPWLLLDLDIAASDAILEALKAKYSYGDWLKVSKPLHNTLREKRQAALICYQKEKMSCNESQLYDYFLIDVQMGACQTTTRIKQAISSVQLFIQRCFMNLESGVHLNEEAWTNWEWMKNYRVWEANRKVFLYPENWIKPDLRVDKTPFFAELENELLQKEVTDESTAELIWNYITNLDAVSHLEICGVYHERGPLNDTAHGNKLHIFGYTHGVPNIYYYRSWDQDSGIWTPWEKVDLDIQGEALVPYKFNGRLYLFWMICKETSEQVEHVENSDGKSPPKHIELQLAWSEYRNGSWKAKKVSAEVMPKGTDLAKFRIPNQNVYFFPSADNKEGDLILSCYASAGEPQKDQKNVWNQNMTYLQSFRMSGSTGRVTVETISSGLKLYHPNRTRIESMRMMGLQDGKVLAMVAGKADDKGNVEAGSQTEVLMIGPQQNTSAQVPSPLYMLYPSQYSPFASQAPFFYKDDFRTFLIRPSRSNDTYYYTFDSIYHPYLHSFMRELHIGGVDGLLTPESQNQTQKFFSEKYKPSLFVKTPFPIENVDFSTQGSFADYNWELFFHIPFLIANKLNENQRFEEAQKWYHYIFNPTVSTQEGQPAAYWRTLPFYNTDTSRTIDDLLKLLQYDGTDEDLLREKKEFMVQVEQWRKHPFDPHIVARLRPTAYQKSIVMHYINNLIAWGDMLFRMDTIESINEATLLYVLAYEILGDRPRTIQLQDNTTPKSYNELEELGLDEFSNALVKLESMLPEVEMETQLANDAPTPQPIILDGTLYFCTPHNEQLLNYWNTVEDRLFKIRNCMNISGVVRQLPLFEPPIDPGLLVRAKAAGVDISTVLSDQGGKTLPYRFQSIFNKALELCSELRSFGTSLLSVLEKRDAEALSILRTNHENKLLSLSQDIRKRQMAEADKQVESLQKYRDMINERHNHYKNIKNMNHHEKKNLELQASAQLLAVIGQSTDAAASVAFALPNFTSGASGAMGSPVSTLTIGGIHVGHALQAFSKSLLTASSFQNASAQMSATMAGYERRSEEWKLQENLAALELEQNEQQIVGAQIRMDITEREHEYAIKQFEQSKEVASWMQEKFTNRELYDWMVSQMSTLYFQMYQLAYDLAKQAEKAYQYETKSQDSFLQFGYWNSLRKGLLSGEQLVFDLKRMESSYLEQNTRKYEITKHISLSLLDPLSLLQLKENGYCYVNVTEDLFDRDYPGHYMRSLKSVSLTIPGVTGPYTGIHATLTVLRSSIRIDNRPGASYPRDPKRTDERFRDETTLTDSIVTSSGVNDGGLFELNFHDERYLPFEGRGAISLWRLELAQESNSFDVDTISDVIFHLKFLAENGGDALKNAAWKSVFGSDPHPIENPTEEQQALSWQKKRRLFSAKHEFSRAWDRFMHPPEDQVDQSLQLRLTPEMFPYSFRDGLKIREVQVFLMLRDAANYLEGNAEPLHLFLNEDLEAMELKFSGDFPTLPHATKRYTISGDGALDIVLSAKENDNLHKISDTMRIRQTGTDGKTVHIRLNPDSFIDIGILVDY